ncbi:hypothetical protein G6F46_001678 [Rhizopus delemar]|uniref:Nudix hydrolase domain-containing protein n=3 Tax=Rhizopus TaxID=4842 RepID=I1BKG3_RHIO9|nr:hypothetical protein RO3G_01397 [Rhizopus delemar RA 99-880]KAG1463197.1 hypothetical protein G6F55_002538 [Rhizopus delemar]KAG1547991.1 hypothetical protein G6F51_003934 [Rhizopus arrhizus]KAG1503960.1 hypothetical protein G6F54_001319 [Rhizopus delemar]KAG1519015.1 hypothetical protein G6F53_000099 [Rhizopus delemar]|eukprot:EIE76693.1 hypothetical protein RO3G_01397 [Rhizopus delemar RA 99-880]
MMVHKTLLEAAQSCDKFPYAFKSTEEMPVPFEHNGALIGHILPSVLCVLKEYNHQNTPSPFVISSGRVTFASWADTFEKRTEVMRVLADHWRKQKTFPVLTGWRNELYPVYGHKEIAFVMERAATPLFGISTFGVHLNAYVVNDDGEIYMWIARRAKTKQTWPGLLDNCVAGGITYQYKIKDTIIKECDEEASIPYELASKARSTNAVTYYTSTPNGLQPETQYIFDLELPKDFVPTPRDGEVDCFYFWPLEKVKETILNGEWKINSAIVMIDFMLRHSFITPDEDPDYIQISYHLHRKLQFPTPIIKT